MPKTSVNDWSTTANDNTDVGGIDLGEGTMVVSAVNGALREMMAQVAAAIAAGDFTTIPFTVASSSAPASLDFAEDTDNGAHKIVLSAPSAVTSDRAIAFPDAAGTVALTSDLTVYAKLDTEDQTLTGGARVTPKSLGEITSGTVTIDPGDRPLQYYINKGAHTLAPGTNTGSIILEISNQTGSGAITTSGFTKVVGAFTTTAGHNFLCTVIRSQNYSLLTIQALQ